MITNANATARWVTPTVRGQHFTPSSLSLSPHPLPSFSSSFAHISHSLSLCCSWHSSLLTVLLSGSYTSTLTSTQFSNLEPFLILLVILLLLLAPAVPAHKSVFIWTVCCEAVRLFVGEYNYAVTTIIFLFLFLRFFIFFVSSCLRFLFFVSFTVQQSWDMT